MAFGLSLNSELNPYYGKEEEDSKFFIIFIAGIQTFNKIYIFPLKKFWEKVASNKKIL